jgi:hypothetical protein
MKMTKIKYLIAVLALVVIAWVQPTPAPAVTPLWGAAAAAAISVESHIYRQSQDFYAGQAQAEMARRAEEERQRAVLADIQRQQQRLEHERQQQEAQRRREMEAANARRQREEGDRLRMQKMMDDNALSMQQASLRFRIL